MQLRDHTAVTSKRDYFIVDPRKLKVDAGYNVPDLSTEDTRAHIADLKESIAVNGVRVPLEVRIAGEDIFVVSGHCRHAAVLELIAEGRDDIKGVPCIPEPKSINDAERVLNLHISNSGKPLTTLEVAEVVRRLEAFGWTEDQIQKRMRWKSRASVTQHAEVASLPEDVKQQVRNGDVAASLAVKIAKDNPETAAELIRANKEENARIRGKGKGHKVTAKTIKRDRAKAEPEQAEAPSMPAHTVAAVPTPEADLVAHVPMRFATAPGDQVSPLQRPGIKALIDALEPFANLAHEHGFNERSDDDVVEVPFRHLKKAWIVFAKVAGSQEGEAA